MKKRIVSILIVLCLVLTLLPATAFAANDANRSNFISDFQTMNHDDSWTAVSSVEDLEAIADNLDGYYYLTGNIDLSGQEWVPIGTQSQPFTGMLDGGGYVISNLTISGRNGRNDFGLFGAVRNAQIFDLGLEKVNIKVDSNSQGSTTASNVGGLVGYATNTSGNSVVIMNCYVTGKVSFNSSGESMGYVGGLVGRGVMNRYSSYYNTSLFISASYNRADVTGSGYTCITDAGGLVGYVGANGQNGLLGIQYSFNTGDVTAYAHNASSNAGGLVGSNGGNSSLFNCYNSGDVRVTGGQGLGGIYRSSFEAGGLVGSSNYPLMLGGSYNYGEVSASNDTSTNDCDVIAGGLLGAGTYQTGIDQCYNAGDVSAEGNYGVARAGGLAGLINAVNEDVYLSPDNSAYLTNSVVLSSSVAVYGRADVSEAALVYTTNEHDRQLVDIGGGNMVWQPGTKDSVKTNTAIAADDITGNAKDNARSRITRDEAKELSTYTALEWPTDEWKMAEECPYPQLFFQTEALGYTGGIIRGELGGSVAIDNSAPKLGDTLTAVTAGLIVTPSEAEMGTLSYQWYRDGAAISGAVSSTYTTVAEDVGHTVKVTVTASNCTGSVSSDATAKVGKGTYTGAAVLTQNIRVGAAGSVTVDLGKLVPDALNAVYTVNDTSDTDGILNGAPAIRGSAMEVAYNQVDAEGKTAVITLTIASDVYEDIIAKVTIQSVNKETLPAGSIVCEDMTVTYDGEAHAIGDASITGDYTGGAFAITYLYTGDSYSSASAPSDAGTYTVTITAENGDYVGTAKATLTINAKPLDDGMLTIAGVTYSGQAQTPVLTVEDGEVPLVKDTDYTVTLAAQTDAGAYPVSITGTGNYSGTATADFVIAPKDIQGAVVTLERAGYVYTGQPIEPVVTSVTVDTLSLTAADYTVSYADNTAIGTGTVIITAKDGGNYTGSAEKSFAITESEYYFAVTAPGTMVVGQTADASVTLEGVDSAQPYDHALIKVSVTGPEGAAPQIMAMDTTGGEHNLAVTGQWGPDTGFQVTGGHSATTPLKLTFDLPGTYTAEFQLVDLDTQEVLGSGTCSIEVGDAYSFTISAPSTMRPNQTAEASATLKGDANAPTYAHALIKITVEAPDGANPKVMAIDSNDVEYNLAEIGQWGPDTGFQVTAGYDVTTPLKLTFDKEGTYKAVFQLVDVDTGKVLGSGEKTITVRTPSSGGGGSVSYAVAVSGSSHGDVKVSPSRASAGSLVTITVTPDEGYVLADLTVTDKSGKEIKVTEKSGGKYTFTMPSSQVTVEAEFVPEDGALPFGDVAESSWYCDAVRYAYDNGLINGVSDTAFAPASRLTRGMLVTLLYRMEKEPAAKGGNVFSDVEADSWYADAVAWSAANGLVEGYEDGAFRPDNAITREQMALILYRYAALKGYDTDAKGDMSVFADGEQVSPWAAEAMTWAVGEQLLSGKGNGVLDPTGTATRAEVAQILMNFCENIAK